MVEKSFWYGTQKELFVYVKCHQWLNIRTKLKSKLLQY